MRGDVALVTGSSRGIGREVAAQLVGRDYRVIVTSRNADDAKRAASEIGAPSFSTKAGASSTSTRPTSSRRGAQTRSARFC